MTQLAAHPFHGSLIDGGEAAAWLQSSLSATQGPVVSLCSAYLRSEALSILLPFVPPGIGGRLLVRWRMGDLLFGASDLQAWEILQSLGWDLYMRLDFHGKVYSIPGSGILVGSANTTGNGLAISATPNAEVCTLVRASDGNLELIDKLFFGATLVTAEIFNQLKIALSEADRKDKAPEDWPQSILELIAPKKRSNILFVGECFWTDLRWLGQDNFEDDARHDFALIGITEADSADRAKVERSFRKSAMYAWLVSSLKSNNSECYFGRLSAELHSALADDPAPHRRDVKFLLQNLLCWVKRLGINEVCIDRPNHSQRIRLLC